MESRNPYGAPQAKLADPAPRPGSPYKAVALGLATDFGGTIALSVALAFVQSVMLASGGMTAEEIEASLQTIDTGSWLFWVGGAGGLAFSGLGGYVCARVAGQSEYTLGVILAALVVVLGEVFFGGGSLDLGMTIVLHVAGVAAVLAGSHIGKTRNRRAKAAVAR
jgi:hypothetical protein